MLQKGVCPKPVPSIRRDSVDNIEKEGWHENQRTQNLGQLAVGREEARNVTKNLALIQGATISPDKVGAFFVRKNRQTGHLEQGNCVSLANL